MTISVQCQVFLSILVYNIFRGIKMHIRLKELRKERGMKLKDVAEAMGVTVRAISRYEEGTREPSVEMIIKFCKLYEVSADYLLGLEDETGTKL